MAEKAEKDEKRRMLLDQLRNEIEGLTNRWKVTAYLSGGSYGEVVGAVDKLTGQKVAIKRVYKAKTADGHAKILQEPFLCKRVFREIKLLSHFNHENILGLVSVMRWPKEGALTKLYMVMECMDTDLSQIIRDTSVNITEEHIQYFMFQILHGLKCLHDAKVIHRDLHPGNILLNAENDIKICDFNLAKADGGIPSTDYVTYRWYRAPELVMQWKNYDSKIDIWSAGAVMGELYNRKPMFPGTSFFNQLDVIVEIIGTPDREDVEHIGSPSAKQYLFRELTGISPRAWGRVVNTRNPLGIDLVSRLLVFNPAKRLDVERALRHDFFKHPTCLFDEEEMSMFPPMEKFHFDEDMSDLQEINQTLDTYIQRIQERFVNETLEGYSDDEQPITPVLGNPSAAAAAKRPAVPNASFNQEMQKYIPRTACGAAEESGADEVDT